ncbi:HAD-IA family hydrolase [Agromyces aerolatus]|uniref:HAD-IA family hydrolase n=1 Tax=Agromyces sp. LY-1074 TaxID=3074080 RepID=UPI0028572104|nr:MULTISPECIES: HAD-IA family hydrolase [unclassified Agromyces]MDR5700577.1 HAD-IA family hydrolase [Agromyces sp. LY-1074]MDR5707098.1 HAD-IA family hydrolase [Agromyces sp. LY-1358]
MRFEIDAVLFDIDGTLVDSTPAVERTWQVWASRRGLDVAEILRVCHGRRSEDTIAMFVAADEQDAAVAELEQLELADLDDVIALHGTRSLLPRLPADRWAAVTSGSQRLMRARLAAAGLPVPEVLVAAEDVGAGKPDPEGYLNAAAALGVSPQRCLVVEDAPAGVDAGIAAGAWTLAVATSHDPTDLRAAHAVVTDLRALSIELVGDELVVTIT